MRRISLYIILCVVSIYTFSFEGREAYSQSEGGRLAFGFNYGLIKYWGEFTDNQFWWGGDLFLRYNIVPWLSLQGAAGLSQIRYKTDDEVLRRYPNYFGANARQGNIYPGTETAPKPTLISDKNAIRVNTYELYLTVNLFSKESFVPYIFVGAGMMDFEPKSGATGGEGALPNNSRGVYEKQILVIPAGLGFEMYLSDSWVFNGRGTFRFTGTDYLDDYAEEGTQDDGFLTFGLGFSYYILGDSDWDKDGLTNKREGEIGTDPNNPDTDGEGLKDGEEVLSYYTDPLKADTDGDLLNDYEELMTHKTSPTKPDTDADNLNDGEEIARKTDPMNPDSDSDDLLDGDEVNRYQTDALNPDTDSDGLNDGDEAKKYNTNPKAQDTDTDGLNDGDEVKTYNTSPSIADTDKDNLLDGLEIKQYRSDPNKPDTDSDKLMDGDEVNNYKTDPLKADTDNDKLTDGDEIARVKTNPLDPDTDKDKVIDGDDDCPLTAGLLKNEDGRRGCPEPPKVGTRTDFPEIFFIVNTDQFNFDMPNTAANLAKLLDYVRQCDGLQVLIEGHASEEGDAAWNQQLSEKRANRVKTWLVEQGVDPNKVSGTIGYGETKPKFKEPTGKALKRMSKQELENLRKQNRRITVEVTRTCDEKPRDRGYIGE